VLPKQRGGLREVQRGSDPSQAHGLRTEVISAAMGFKAVGRSHCAPLRIVNELSNLFPHLALLALGGTGDDKSKGRA
jgi:hypothetical protein